MATVHSKNNPILPDGDISTSEIREDFFYILAFMIQFYKLLFSSIYNVKKIFVGKNTGRPVEFTRSRALRGQYRNFLTFQVKLADSACRCRYYKYLIFKNCPVPNVKQL